MKKAYVKCGLLAVCATAGLALVLALTLTRPAMAQGNESQTVGVMVEPLILTDEVYRFEVSVYAWGRSHAPSPVETTIEVTYTGIGPAGPYQVVRKHTLTRTSVLAGVVERISLVRTEHGWDGYYKGDLFASFDRLAITAEVQVRVYTHWHNPGPGVVYGGSSQAITTDGHTVGSWAANPLTGNVRLMK